MILLMTVVSYADNDENQTQSGSEETVCANVSCSSVYEDTSSEFPDTSLSTSAHVDAASISSEVSSDISIFVQEETSVEEPDSCGNITETVAEDKTDSESTDSLSANSDEIDVLPEATETVIDDSIPPPSANTEDDEAVPQSDGEAENSIEINKQIVNGYYTISFYINGRYEVVISGIGTDTSDDELLVIANDVSDKFMSGPYGGGAGYSVSDEHEFDFDSFITAYKYKQLMDACDDKTSEKYLEYEELYKWYSQNTGYNESDFAYDVSLIDAEKNSFSDYTIDTKGHTDTMLCWAASASDMLWYSGWAQKAINPLTGEVFKNEDEVFSWLRESYTDWGDYQDTAIRYIFNGVDDRIDDADTAKLRPEAEDTDNYSAVGTKEYKTEDNQLLNDYCVSNLMNHTWIYDVENFAVTAMESFEKLKDGVSIGLCVQQSGGAHAVTVFGYIKDTLADIGNALKAIFIADSDSDVPNPSSADELEQLRNIYTYDGTNIVDLRYGSNRRNSYQMYFTTDAKPKYQGRDVYTYYMNGYGAIFRSIIELEPYSEKSIEASIETDPDATKNLKENADLVPKSLYVTDAEQSSKTVSSFTEGSAVYLGFELDNISMATINASDDITVRFTLYRVNVNGENEVLQEVKKVDTVYNYDIDRFGYMIGYANLGNNLSEGTYKVFMSVNGDKSIAEAYYKNNSLENGVYFTVNKSEYIVPGPTQSSGAAKICFVSGYSEYTDVESVTVILLEKADIEGGTGDSIDFGKLYVKYNGELVNPEYYTVCYDEDGNLRLILTEEFIKIIGMGEHLFDVHFDDYIVYVKLTMADLPK